MDSYVLSVLALSLSTFTSRLAAVILETSDPAQTSHLTLVVFHKELAALSAVLGSLSEGLRNSSFQEAIVRYKQHLTILKTTLEHCDLTLKALDVRLCKSEDGGRHGIGVFRRSAPAHKLDLSLSELQLMRNQVNIYLDAFRLTLNLVIIFITANAKLVAVGGDIQVQQDFSAAKKEIASLRTLFLGLQETENVETETLQELLDSSEELVAKASRYYGFQRFSVVGFTPSGESKRNDKIRNWIPEPNITEDNSENDPSFSTISELKRRGEELLSDGDYVGAETSLQDFIVKAADSGWEMDEVLDGYLKMAMALSGQKKYEKARALLKNYQESASLIPVNLQMQHRLAEVCLLCDDIPGARRYVKFALNGRWTVFGKDNDLSFQSLHLFVLILQLSGDSKAAEKFRRNLPMDFKADHIPGWKPPSSAVFKPLSQKDEHHVVHIAKVTPLSYDPIAKLGRLEKQTTLDTKLYECCEEGFLNRATSLIENGADPNATKDGVPCLQAAQDPNIVKLLIKSGADVNKKGGRFGNALQNIAANILLSEKDSLEILELLLGAGADPNQNGGYYGYALQGAAGRTDTSYVDRLLSAGADVNAEGGQFGTALQRAAFIGSYHMVQRLLDAGANVNTRGGEHGSPLQAAKDCVRLGVSQKNPMRKEGGEMVLRLLLLESAY